jgi:hypothetical protein
MRTSTWYQVNDTYSPIQDILSLFRPGLVSRQDSKVAMDRYPEKKVMLKSLRPLRLGER